MGKNMKAAVYRKYGGPEVLHIAEVSKPSPQNTEVLIKVYTTTVSSGDVKMRSFKDIPFLPWLPFRLLFPSPPFSLSLQVSLSSSQPSSHYPLHRTPSL